MATRVAAQIGTILVYVGLDAVGDGLMKLPFVRALRAAFPAARITWMAGKGHTVYADSLACLVTGLIDEVLDECGVGSRVAELAGPRPLAGRAFDLVIDTQRRILTTLILRRVRHRTFLSAAGNYWLSDIRPRERRKPAAMVDQLLMLADLACGRPVAVQAPLPRDPVAEWAAGELLPPGPAYVGFAPGAGGRHKCWPLDRYIELARRLTAEGWVPVFLLGPAEAEWAAAIATVLPEARLPLQQAAEVTPMLTIELARRLSAAVANDSGTGHMLAAADVPLVSLFGPTPPEKFAPRTRRLTVVAARAWGGEAMDLIPVEAVAAAVRGML